VIAVTMTAIKRSQATFRYRGRADPGRSTRQERIPFATAWVQLCTQIIEELPRALTEQILSLEPAAVNLALQFALQLAPLAVVGNRLPP
jgi:hypothetical protein